MPSSTRAPAVSHAAAILTVVSRAQHPLTVSGIVEATGLPRSSVQRICEALALHRMLKRGADGSYWLGAHVAELAASARLSNRYALRFGVLIASRENAYYTAMLRAADSHVGVVGGELLVRDASEDLAKQRAQWRDLLEDEVDVILIDAVAANGLDDLMTQSRDARIPVVAIGTRIDDADAAVTSDNTQAGVLAGHELAAHFPAGGRVAIIDGLRKNANADRIAGFVDALRDYPELQIVAQVPGNNDNAEAGRKAARELLTTDPDIDGLFTVCDPLAFGVSAQLTRMAKKIPIVGVDGRAQAVNQIIGDGLIIATVAQDPGQIIRVALDIARELHDGTRPAERTVRLPVRLINRENASGYLPWG